MICDWINSNRKPGNPRQLQRWDSDEPVETGGLEEQGGAQGVGGPPRCSSITYVNFCQWDQFEANAALGVKDDFNFAEYRFVITTKSEFALTAATQHPAGCQLRALQETRWKSRSHCSVRCMLLSKLPFTLAQVHSRQTTRQRSCCHGSRLYCRSAFAWAPLVFTLMLTGHQRGGTLLASGPRWRRLSHPSPTVGRPTQAGQAASSSYWRNSPIGCCSYCERGLGTEATTAAPQLRTASQQATTEERQSTQEQPPSNHICSCRNWTQAAERKTHQE